MREEEALELLDSAIKEIAELKKQPRSHTDRHIRWISNTTNILEEIFGDRSLVYSGFIRLTFRFRGHRIIDGWDPNVEVDRLDYEWYLRDLEVARGLLQSGVDQIDRKGINNVYERRDPSKDTNLIVHILSAIRSQLRKNVREVPDKEGTVQDCLETIFNVKEFDFLREIEHIDYSSKAYVPDFTFPSISATVEVKLCNNQRKEKDIIGEINDDILAYSTKYSNLIFVVYDVGIIRDVDKFRNSFIDNTNVIVEIIKH